MRKSNDEVERIRRIRERQLRARDPLKGQRKRDRITRSKFKKKNDTLGDMLREIPAKWWGMIIGGLVGFVIAFVLERILNVKLLKIEAFWVEYLWYTLIFFGIAIGRGLAAAMDWAAEDHDKLVTRGRR